MFLSSDAPVHFRREMRLAEEIATVRAAIQCRFVADGAPALCHCVYLKRKVSHLKVGEEGDAWNKN